MTQKIYGIHDKDLDFIFVTLENNDAIAIRNFADAVNDEKSNLHKHPENFKLMRICEFEMPSRKFVQTEMQVLVTAKECLISSEKK